MPIHRLPPAAPSPAPSAALMRPRRPTLLATHISNAAPALRPVRPRAPAPEPAPDYPGAIRGYPAIPVPDY